MKKIAQLFIVIALMGFTAQSCKQKTTDDKIDTEVVNNPATASGEPSTDMPVMEFEKTTHDFGKIKQGEKVSFSFKFKNTGKTDLVISSASGSCGCTVPQYPKMPIAPGESAVIDVTFDSSGKSGMQNKQVTIVANTNPSATVLTVTGEVEVPAEKK